MLGLTVICLSSGWSEFHLIPVMCDLYSLHSSLRSPMGVFCSTSILALFNIQPKGPAWRFLQLLCIASSFPVSFPTNPTASAGQNLVSVSLPCKTAAFSLGSTFLGHHVEAAQAESWGDVARTSLLSKKTAQCWLLPNAPKQLLYVFCPVLLLLWQEGKSFRYCCAW